jgi:hypothetical protein
MTAPLCIHCGREAVLAKGKEIYPHRPDLHRKPFWRCFICDAYCGCHPGTKLPLGRPGNADLRNARTEVHKILDPLWKDAWKLPGYGVDKLDGTFQQKEARRAINRRARDRAYLFLGHAMKLAPEKTHTGEFDLDQCREAWRVLSKQTSESIRTWAKDRHL